MTQKATTPNEDAQADLQAGPAVDDKPQVVKADLRKFNRTEAIVTKTVEALQAIVKVETQEDLDKAMEILRTAKTVENTIEQKRKDLGAPFKIGKEKIDAHAKTLTAKLPPAILAVKNAVLAYNTAQEKIKTDQRNEARRLTLVGLGFNRQEAPLENRFIYRGSDPETYLVVSLAELEGFDDNSWSNKVTELEAGIKTIKDAEICKLQDKKADADFFGDAETSEIDKKIADLKAPAPPPAHVPAFGGSSKASSSVKGVTKTWTFEVQDASQVPREFLIIDETKIRQAIQSGTRTIAGVRIFQKEGLTVR